MPLLRVLSMYISCQLSSWWSTGQNSRANDCATVWDRRSDGRS